MADAQNTTAGGTPEATAAAGGTPANGSGQQPQTQPPGGTPASFDEWLDAQDEPTQKLIDTHVAGLKSSLASERERARKLEKDLKSAAKGLEEANPLKAQLEEAVRNLGEARAQADFNAEAHNKGVSNLKLAFSAAKQEGLIDDKGRVDFDELKKQFPELFAAPRAAPPGKGGAGKDAPPPKLSGNAAMNAAIRSMAGIT